MTCKPIIGINTDYRQADRNKPAFSYLAAGYFQSIAAAGGIPVIIPPMDDPESISTGSRPSARIHDDRWRGLGSQK